jgi:nucleoid DNA-binding protein
VRSRKARKGRNPQTGAVINIKASRTVGFKPSPTFKKGL